MNLGVASPQGASAWRQITKKDPDAADLVGQPAQVMIQGSSDRRHPSSSA